MDTLEKGQGTSAAVTVQVTPLGLCALSLAKIGQELNVVLQQWPQIERREDLVAAIGQLNRLLDDGTDIIAAMRTRAKFTPSQFKR